MTLLAQAMQFDQLELPVSPWMEAVVLVLPSGVRAWVVWVRQVVSAWAAAGWWAGPWSVATRPTRMREPQTQLTSAAIVGSKIFDDSQVNIVTGVAMVWI